jgi:phospholipase A-2-activating protein
VCRLAAGAVLFCCEGAQSRHTATDIPPAHPPCHTHLPCCTLQIVQFILQNTGGPQQSLGDLPITGGFCDPFTGGGTGETSAPPPRPAPAPAAPTGPISITGGFCDPFTGGASSSRGGAGSSSSSSSQLPARVYLLFDGPPPAEGLRKKLLEFNAVLQSSPELGPAALITEQEAAAGGERRGACCW